MNMNDTHADETRKVRFHECSVVVEFQPIVDPKLKKEMYYSTEELYIIRKRFEIEIALHRQAVRARALERVLQAKKADLLVSSHKRPLITGMESPVVGVSNKRRRKLVPSE